MSRRAARPVASVGLSAALAVVALGALTSGCGGDGSQPTSSSTLPFAAGVPHAYEERYLAEHPGATLDPRHTVIFRLDSSDDGGDTGGPGTDVAQYTFARATDLTLMRDDADPLAPTLVLKDGAGRVLTSVGSTQHEASITVPPGNYNLELHASSTAGETQTIFLRPLVFTPGGIGSNAADVAKLMANQSCPNCDFSGLTWTSGMVQLIDLSGSNFAGSNLGAVSTELVNLERTVFDGSILGNPGGPGINFDTSNFGAASFRNVTFNSGILSVDLFANAVFDNSHFIDACLQGSLDGASFSQVVFDATAGICGADFNGADLSAAQFIGTTTSNCTCNPSASGLSFLGAILNAGNSATFFGGVDLDGLSFAGMNLQSVDFVGSTLRGANLSGANLSAANLTETILDGANLSQATLEGTNLEDAFLLGINGVGASFKCAQLIRTNLAGALLSTATFDQAFMPDAVLTDADLRGASLIGASIYGRSARIDRALLDGADFTSATLSGMDFSVVQAAQAKFNSAQLVNCSFDGANISMTNFENTYLQGASFSGAQVNMANFTNAALSFTDCTPCNAGETQAACTSRLAAIGQVPCWTYVNGGGFPYLVVYAATNAGAVATDIDQLVCPSGCTTCVVGQCPTQCNGPCATMGLVAAAPPSPAIPDCTPFSDNWCPPSPQCAGTGARRRR